MKRSITVTINGTTYQDEVEPRLLLVDYLRENCGLTGTHVGCDTSQCGACTVHLDGRAVKSCSLFAVQVDGRSVKTIEGLGGAEMHPLQKAFWDEHGLQCGFCTPGFIMAAAQLLADNPEPTDEDIVKALEGNVCRCTGYENIMRAVHSAVKATRAPAATSAPVQVGG